MKKVMVLAVIGVFALSMIGAAYAADVKATVAGKISVADKVASVKVSEAKGDDGKAIADLAGKSLTISGAKAADAVKLAGKDAVIKGTVKDGKDIAATDVAEKKAAAPAPKPAAPAPAPAPAAPAK